MKKQLFPLILALIFSFALSGSAFGVEGSTFVDVAPGDWFAPYVEVCVEAGLMNGVGGGRFDPQGEVTYAQAATLAARIHHIKNGGDGFLSQAPEDYGTVTLEFENGVRLRFDSAECRSTISPMSRGHLVAHLSEENWEAMAWLNAGKEALATVSAVLPGPIGPLPCTARRQSGSDGDALVLYPSPDGTPEEREAVDNLVGDLFNVDRRPLPGDWYRDTVYYLETERLGNLAFLPLETDSPAPRERLVYVLYEAARDLLAPINQIADYPDSPISDVSDVRDIVLAFYNAGVLSGRDEYGTFDGKAGLTRAECAAICARILKPELRLKFQLKPVPEKYSYTLTYLMDDPMVGHMVRYPVLPIITDDGENNGILTLNGELLPWPGDGEKPVGMLGDNNAGALYLSFWFTQPDGSRVEKGGLMDETGAFVVPLTAGCYRARTVKEGYLSQIGQRDGGEVFLWDREGNAVSLGSQDWDALWRTYLPDPAAGEWNGVRTGGGCYVDERDHRLSEDFEWAGALTRDGRGFVRKDGKLYRIQFKNK